MPKQDDSKIVFDEDLKVVKVGDKCRRVLGGVVSKGDELCSVVKKIRHTRTMTLNSECPSLETIELVISVYVDKEDKEVTQINLGSFARPYRHYKHEDVAIVSTTSPDLTQYMVKTISKIHVSDTIDDIPFEHAVTVRVVDDVKFSETKDNFGVVFVNSLSNGITAKLRANGYNGLIIEFTESYPSSHSTSSDGLIYPGMVGFHRTINSILSRYLK